MPGSNFRISKKRYAGSSSNQYFLEHSLVFNPLLTELEKVLELSVLKAVAQFKDSVLYPMPASQSPVLEQILSDRLRSLKPEKQEIAIANFDARIKKIDILSGSEYSDMYTYGVMEALKNPVPVMEKATELLRIKSEGLGMHLNTQLAAGANISHTMSDEGGMQVFLRIHKIRCVDETDPESGDDEIALAATIVEPNGNTRKIAPVLIRDDFDDEQEKKREQVYQPAWNFASFNLWERFDTGPFPRYCSCLFVLSELDNGGFPQKIQEIYDLLRDAVTKAVSSYISGAIGGAFGGPVGMAIGAAVGYLMDKLFGLLKDIWEDDVFPPVSVEKYFRDKYSNFDGSMFSPMYTCVFNGFGGTYSLDYSWQMKGYLETPHGLADGYVPEPETLSGAIIYKNTYYDGDSKFLAPGSYSFGGRSAG